MSTPTSDPAQDSTAQDSTTQDSTAQCCLAQDEVHRDPYVRALRRLFRDNPVWSAAMGCIVEGARSNVYFTHLPQCVWHLVKDGDTVDLRPGCAAQPDFVFRFPPAAVVALSHAAGAADAVAVTLFDLMLDPDPARHVDFRIVAPYRTLARHGHVRLLLTSGPKVLAYGAAHGIRTPGQLRDLVGAMRRRAPAAWEI